MILLSASAIKDFITCERKYWYRRYASDLAEPSEPLIRGRVVHEVIEKYWDDPESGYFFLGVSGDNQDEFNFDLAKAKGHLDSFYTSFSPILQRDDLIEQKFKIKYRDGVYLVGTFDRVIPKTGVVIDWKTNRSIPRDLSNDPQFLLYYHAYTKLNGSPPSVVYFASLTRGKFVKFNFEQTKLDILLNEIIPDMLEHIENKKFNPTGLFRNITCNFCSFKEHCHYKYLGLEKPNELDSTEFNFR